MALTTQTHSTARCRRHHLQRLDWDVSWLCYWQLTTDGYFGQRTWQPHSCRGGRKREYSTP
eukprot:6450919-Pyramimonas_sp.AAC.1